LLLLLLLPLLSLLLLLLPPLLLLPMLLLLLLLQLLLLLPLLLLLLLPLLPLLLFSTSHLQLVHRHSLLRLLLLQSLQYASYRLCMAFLSLSQSYCKRMLVGNCRRCQRLPVTLLLVCCHLQLS
jgi:hypothetical protein